MAEEPNNTTTTGTGADPAPAAGSQTTPEGTPAPTTEQKNAFQKFWDSLFGGKGEHPPLTVTTASLLVMPHRRKRRARPIPRLTFRQSWRRRKPPGRPSRKKKTGLKSCPRRNGSKQKVQPRTRS